MLLNIETRNYKKVLLLTGEIFIIIFSAAVLGMMTASEKHEFLPLVLILGLCGFLLILKHPMVGFALMFFFVSLAPITQISKALSAGGILVGGSTLSALIALLLAGVFISRVLLLHEKVKFDRLSVFLCLFVFWGIMTTLWAYDIMLSFVFIFRILQMAILYILALNFCRNESQIDLLTICFISGTIIAAAIPLLTGTTLFGSETRATLSVGADPNFFAAGVGLAMVLIFYYLRMIRHSIGKAILILGLIFTSYLIIRAQSRGVWIAMSGSFLISAVLLTLKDTKSVKNAIKISVLLIALVISAYFAGIVDEDIISRLDTLAGDPRVATSYRSDIWKVGLRMTVDNLPSGVGFKNFEIAYNSYAQGLEHLTGASKDPHNSFIAVIAETGPIGFAIFVGMFIYLFKGVRHILNPIKHFTYLWLLIYLVLVSSTITFHYTSWFWCAVIFISLGVKLDRQSALKTKKQAT